MTDAPKTVADATKEPVVTETKKPDVAGPVAATTPVAEPVVEKK